jgi:hypothetical protein
VHVKVIYSPPGKHGLEKPAHQLYNTLHRLQLPSNLFEFQLPASVSKIHAKLLATEKGAMLGSHNYVTPGVRLGTGEIALQIHDPQFSREAVLAIARLLPPLYGYAE